MAQRDLTGYGSNPPAVGWPGGARIAVSVVVNYEEGSEYSILDGDPIGETGGESPSPVTRPDGVFLVYHEFAESGDYIGIVTATHPTLDRTYTSVFPFHVGEATWGYVPLFIGIALLLQINYWLMTGGFSRWRNQRKRAARK